MLSLHSATPAAQWVVSEGRPCQPPPVAPRPPSMPCCRTRGGVELHGMRPVRSPSCMLWRRGRSRQLLTSARQAAQARLGSLESQCAASRESAAAWEAKHAALEQRGPPARPPARFSRFSRFSLISQNALRARPEARAHGCSRRSAHARCARRPLHFRLLFDLLCRTFIPSFCCLCLSSAGQTREEEWREDRREHESTTRT